MKGKILLVTILGVLLSTHTAMADLKVGPEGNVGIGTEPTATNALQVIAPPGVYGAGVFTTEYAANWNIALYGAYTGDTCANVTGVSGYSRPCSGYGIGGYFHGGKYGVKGYATPTSSGEGSLYAMYGYAGDGKYNTGITGYAYSGSSSTGVYARGYYGTYSYGVRAYGYGTYGYGIYAYGTKYAGYFGGTIAYTGNLTRVSDKKLKKNIKPMGSVLGKLMNLKAKTFHYKKDDPKYKAMNLAHGKKFGLIAQELEEVFPELVSEDLFVFDQDIEDSQKTKEGATPEPSAPKEPETINYKSINYLELIPILIQAIQEQQQEIEGLKDAVSKQKSNKSKEI